MSASDVLTWQLNQAAYDISEPGTNPEGVGRNGSMHGEPYAQYVVPEHAKPGISFRRFFMQHLELMQVPFTA